MHALYLLGLLIGISGLTFIDYRYKLAYWQDRARTIKTLAVGVGVFVVWDLVGIFFGIFFPGNTRASLGLYLLPRFPVEELFFLYLLCYVTLLLHQWKRRV